MNYPSASTLTLVILLPLLGWRLYSRFKRMVGRQRLSRVRPWITLAIFPTLVLLICAATLSHPERLWLLAAGLCAGAPLGIFGLRKTKFEPTREGLFYTPHAHLGIALSALFMARIAYRFVEVFALEPGAAHGMQDFARSPLTLSIFGLLASYYITYAIGLIRWRYRVFAAKRRREAEQAGE